MNEHRKAIEQELSDLIAEKAAFYLGDFMEWLRSEDPDTVSFCLELIDDMASVLERPLSRSERQHRLEAFWDAMWQDMVEEYAQAAAWDEPMSLAMRTPILTVEESRLIEREASCRGLGFAQMMENAGRGLAAIVHALGQENGWEGAAGLVGSGNNGGDTLVALSWLAEAGWRYVHDPQFRFHAVAGTGQVFETCLVFYSCE